MREKEYIGVISVAFYLTKEYRTEGRIRQRRSATWFLTLWLYTVFDATVYVSLALGVLILLRKITTLYFELSWVVWLIILGLWMTQFKNSSFRVRLEKKVEDWMRSLNARRKENVYNEHADARRNGEHEADSNFSVDADHVIHYKEPKK